MEWLAEDLIMIGKSPQVRRIIEIKVIGQRLLE